MKNLSIFGIIVISIFFGCDNNIKIIEDENLLQTKGYGSCCCAPVNLSLSANDLGQLVVQWKTTHNVNNKDFPHNNDKPEFDYDSRYNVLITGGIYESYSFVSSSVVTSYRMQYGDSYNVTVNCPHNVFISGYYFYNEGGQSQFPCPYRYSKMVGTYNYLFDSCMTMSRLILDVNFITPEGHDSDNTQTYRVFADLDSHETSYPQNIFDGYLKRDQSNKDCIEIPHHIILQPGLKNVIQIKISHSNCEIYGKHYNIIECDLGNQLNGNFESTEIFD